MNRKSLKVLPIYSTFFVIYDLADSSRSGRHKFQLFRYSSFFLRCTPVYDHENDICDSVLPPGIIFDRRQDTCDGIRTKWYALSRTFTFYIALNQKKNLRKWWPFWSLKIFKTEIAGWKTLSSRRKVHFENKGSIHFHHTFVVTDFTSHYGL